jgi:hypothetical protein
MRSVQVLGVVGVGDINIREVLLKAEEVGVEKDGLISELDRIGIYNRNLNHRHTGFPIIDLRLLIPRLFLSHSRSRDYQVLLICLSFIDKDKDRDRDNSKDR